LVVGLHRLQYEHDGSFFTADDVEATVALASLLSGDSSLRRVVLVRPRLEVESPTSIGIVASREARRHALAMLDVAERVDVVDGTVVFRDAPPESTGIEGVTGGMEIREGDLRLVLRGQAGGGTLDVNGTIGGDDAPLVLTVAGREVAASTLGLLGGRVQGRTDVRLDVTSAAEGIRMNGRIALRDGRWIGGGPAGRLALDQPIRRALGATAPQLAGEDLPFDELRAVVAWRRGTWRLPRVFVSVGDVVAGGAGRVRADGMVEGSGTLSLPPTLVRDLAPFDAGLTTFRDDTGAATLPFAVGGSVSAVEFTLGRR
jgi:hypothetical protein